MKKKILIIGGVAGGATAAARLRRNDEFAEIILFERGEFISFANCGLPYYIGGVIQSRDSLIVQTVEDITSKFNIDVRTMSEVTSINRKSKTITVHNIKTDKSYDESYDAIIISTGSVPIKPNIPGINTAKNIFTLRNIPDTDNIKNYIDTFKPKSAVVVGGGFIGIEMAENLNHLGINVTLVEMAAQVMTPLDFELAVIVHTHMQDKGVNLILNNAVKEFKNNGKQILLSDGKVIDTDMIILAIGIKPENYLAKESGLAIGDRGGILTNDFLQTTDPEIYAIGDAIETKDFITKQSNLIPLAGPANKQGRIAADNIFGKKEQYHGALGTSAVKAFDLTAASTGNNEKNLKKLNLPYQALHIHPGSHAGYYPGSATISMKILYNPETEEIYGAQAVGLDGVDKRIDVLATALASKMKVTDLKNLELAYAPPFSSAKDPVNMLGFVAENVQRGLIKTFQWYEVNDLIASKAFILDVREEIETELGNIEGSVNIPFAEIRSNLDKLPKDKPIYLFCHSGVRGHSVTRILRQRGFDAYNLSGGYKTYQNVYKADEVSSHNHEIDDSGFLKIDPTIEKEKPMKEKTITLSVNACGLQCPGPIVQVYKSLQTLKDGEVLEITATDPGFMRDIKSWADKTKNTLLDVTLKDGIVTAQVQKGNAALEDNKDVMVSNGKENTTIVVFSQDLDKAIAAFIIATGAASMGKKVSLFFTFWGLNILRKPKKVRVKKTMIEKMFGKMMPRGAKKLPISNMNMGGMGPKMIRYIMKKKNVDSLQVLMAQANSLGVKIIACAMSMDIMGIKKEELLDGIDIAGVATYLGETTEANHNLFI